MQQTAMSCMAAETFPPEMWAGPRHQTGLHALKCIFLHISCSR